MVDPSIQPDKAATNREEFQQAMAAVQSLPEIDRTVFLLRAEQDLPYEEIAAITGLSITAAKVKVFRARAKLCALLQSETKPKL